MSERIDFYSAVARRKLGKGPDWRWCNIRSVGPDGTLVEGGVPRPLKSGSRKGKLTWRDNPLESCVVTCAEVQAARDAYEHETGYCWECQGTKLEFASWSATDGTKYKQCRRCAGTGAKP